VTQRTQASRANDAGGAELEIRRLRWRCRRGMKELDVVLERFAQHGLADAGEEERRALAELLALADPQLADYLLGGLTPAAPHLARLVEQIRALCRSGRPVGAILTSGTD
jgi:antitoxin CptB